MVTHPGRVWIVSFNKKTKISGRSDFFLGTNIKHFQNLKIRKKKKLDDIFRQHGFDLNHQIDFMTFVRRVKQVLQIIRERFPNITREEIEQTGILKQGKFKDTEFLERRKDAKQVFEKVAEFPSSASAGSSDQPTPMVDNFLGVINHPITLEMAQNLAPQPDAD